MPNPFACILTSDTNYLLGVQSFINSFLAFELNKYCDIILTHDGWDISVLQTGTYNLVGFDAKKEFGNFSITSRNEAALRFADSYKAFALFDADMYLTGDITNFFKCAAAGFPTACNEDSHCDQKGYIDTRSGKPVCDNYSYKLFCNAPFFFNPTDGEKIWKDYMEMSKGYVHGAGDLEIFNLSMTKNPEILDRTIAHPSCVFTGIHHTMLKPQTAYTFHNFRNNIPTLEKIVNKYFILTRDFLRVYSIHGKYWDGSWVEGLIKPMYGFYDNEIGLTPAHKDRWIHNNKNVIRELQKIFLDLVFHGEIKLDSIKHLVKKEHLNYIHLKYKEYYDKALFNT